MNITLKDIAEKSGFSITTVSRALAGYSDVNQKTREEITQIAAMMGYQPNLLARQLRSQRTQTLGLIIPANDHSFSNDFFTQLMLGIGDVAAQEHYDLLISAQIPGQEEMAAYRRMVGGNRVDGIILARTRQQDPRIAYLKEQQHPFVVSGRSAPSESSDFPYIDVDSQSGIRQLVAHFVELGHRDIGLILPPPDIAYTEYRHMGYREGLEQAGLGYHSEYIVHGDLQRAGGYEKIQALLNHNPHLTAVIICNDLMALGAISALQAHGLSVGDDIAIAGFDDIPAAEYAHPSLTTVHQPIYDIGQQLVTMLISIIDKKPLSQIQMLIEPHIVIRASSGKPR
jgi:LacI family transcriptional regulator